MSRPRDLVTISRTTITVAREHQVSVAAASLGYHAFNTLIPLLLFLFIGLSMLGELGGAARAAEALTGVSASQAESSLQSMTQNSQGRFRAAVLAFLILAWSAVRTFRTTNAAFERVYGRHEFGLVEQVVDVALVSVTVPLALALVGIVGVAVSVLVDGLLWRLLSPLLLLVALIVAFLPVYYLLPDPEVSLREVLPGTVFAAVAWTGSGLFFRFYASMSQSVHLYGAVGGLLLVLTWLYLGGLAILVGVVINAVLADRVDTEEQLFQVDAERDRL